MNPSLLKMRTTGENLSLYWTATENIQCHNIKDIDEETKSSISGTTSGNEREASGGKYCEL